MAENVVSSGGCSCKIGPAELKRILCGIDFPTDERLLVGLGEPDDAGVYKLTDDIALVQTVDFFPPPVDDLFLFGEIAATNALSDVYAMGGKPLTALNIFCFPIGKMPEEYATQIIAGGMATLKRADCTSVGGHSLNDSPIKYGLAVTGIINPNKIKTKKGALPKDRIILTKPIGTGIISTALKVKMAEKKDVEEMFLSMKTLNRIASEKMQIFDVHACTDVTGFSLLGHLWECISETNISAHISLKSVPMFNGVTEYASYGCMPVGLYRNKAFYGQHVNFAGDTEDLNFMVLFDPQTSGGLLMFVNPNDSEKMLSELNSNGIPAKDIGYIEDSPQGAKIYVD